MDGIGMGLGFTAALTIAGAIREILGTGKVFGARKAHGLADRLSPPSVAAQHKKARIERECSLQAFRGAGRDIQPRRDQHAVSFFRLPR